MKLLLITPRTCVMLSCLRPRRAGGAAFARHPAHLRPLSLVTRIMTSIAQSLHTLPLETFGPPGH